MALPPLPVGAMNRTLSLIPSRHAALSPAPPLSRHVVGVKAWGEERHWGRNPRPSSLSAGEYPLLPGRDT